MAEWAAEQSQAVAAPTASEQPMASSEAAEAERAARQAQHSAASSTDRLLPASPSQLAPSSPMTTAEQVFGLESAGVEPQPCLPSPATPASAPLSL